MQRLLLTGILILAAPVLAAPANAAVRSGPAGNDFYTPPASLPKGAHGTPIWQRKLTGKPVLKSAKTNTLLLYSSQAVRRQDGRGLRHGRDPEGQGAEGRLAGHHVGARNGRDRRRLRSVAHRHPGQLRQPAAQQLAEGGLRGRPHRLRGPRHARRAPVPDRRLRRPQRARHGARRAQAGPEPEQARRHLRSLPGRPCRAVGRVAEQEVHARPEAARAPSRSRPPTTSASRARSCAASPSRAASAAWRR